MAMDNGYLIEIENELPQEEAVRLLEVVKDYLRENVEGTPLNGSPEAYAKYGSGPKHIRKECNENQRRAYGLLWNAEQTTDDFKELLYERKRTCWGFYKYETKLLALLQDEGVTFRIEPIVSFSSGSCMGLGHTVTVEDILEKYKDRKI